MATRRLLSGRARGSSRSAPHGAAVRAFGEPIDVRTGLLAALIGGVPFWILRAHRTMRQLREVVAGLERRLLAGAPVPKTSRTGDFG